MQMLLNSLYSDYISHKCHVSDTTLETKMHKRRVKQLLVSPHAPFSMYNKKPSMIILNISISSLEKMEGV